MSARAPDATSATGRPQIRPLLVWYAVLGGPAAWALHLGVAWSVTELACMAPSTNGVYTHGGSLGTTATAAVWLGTVLPWLLTVAAVAACILVDIQRRRMRDLPRTTTAGPDDLARERIALLLVLGWFLSLMSLAAITGGAVALAVLEPCI